MRSPQRLLEWIADPSSFYCGRGRNSGLPAFSFTEKRRSLSGTGDAGRRLPHPGTENHDVLTGFQYILPDGRGHNEGFAVVDDGGREGTVRTLNPRLTAFHKVEDVDGVMDVDDPAAKERMALGLNKLQSVQSGSADKAITSAWGDTGVSVVDNEIVVK